MGGFFISSETVTPNVQLTDIVTTLDIIKCCFRIIIPIDKGLIDTVFVMWVTSDKEFTYLSLATTIDG